MIYYIFRHGETYFSKFDLDYGDDFEKAEILPESIPVIERLANYLKDKISDFNFTSPFKRAVQTTDIISKITGKTFTPDERIKEEGLSRAQETLDELEERIRNFIEETKSKNYPVVSVCSHGWPIAALIALLTKGFLAKPNLGNFPRCGELIIIEDKNLKTLDFNNQGA